MLALFSCSLSLPPLSYYIYNIVKITENKNRKVKKQQPLIKRRLHNGIIAILIK
jgi:hypothetical protein